MPITRSQPQLPPFTRLVHWGIALSFIAVMLSAGRMLDLHVWSGLTLGVLLLIWIVLMCFGLTRKRGETPSLMTQLLRLALLVLLLLTVAAGIGVYGFGYGGGPLAGVMAGNPELGALAIRVHRPLALAALVIAVIHAIDAGLAKMRARRNKLRRS